MEKNCFAPGNGGGSGGGGGGVGMAGGEGGLPPPFSMVLNLQNS